MEKVKAYTRTQPSGQPRSVQFRSFMYFVEYGRYQRLRSCLGLESSVEQTFGIRILKNIFSILFTLTPPFAFCAVSRKFSMVLFNPSTLSQCHWHLAVIAEMGMHVNVLEVSQAAPKLQTEYRKYKRSTKLPGLSGRPGPDTRPLLFPRPP